jgi:hypothetical protein
MTLLASALYSPYDNCPIFKEAQNNDALDQMLIEAIDYAKTVKSKDITIYPLNEDATENFCFVQRT